MEAQGKAGILYHTTQLNSTLYHTIQLCLAPTLFYCRGILHHSTQLLSIPLWLLFNSSRSSARHGAPFHIQCKATLGSPATQLNYFITTLQWTKKIGPKKLYSCTTLFLYHTQLIGTEMHKSKSNIVSLKVATAY